MVIWYIVVAGAIDERTVEPSAETDDHQTVLERTVDGGRPVLRVGRCQTPPTADGGGSRAAAVAPEVLATGLQLRGLPEAAGH